MKKITKEMKMKNLKIIWFAGLIALLAACEDSSSPTDSDLYKYTRSEDKVMMVITQGGAEVPESEWSDVIKQSYDEYKRNVSVIKKIDIRLESDTLYRVAKGQSSPIPYRMSGDTIIVKMLETEHGTWEINQALKIDENTIEQHYACFAQDLKYVEGGDVSNIIGDHEEFRSNFNKRKPDLEEGDQIALFFERLIFEK